MQKTITLKLTPEAAADESAILAQIAAETQTSVSAISGYTLLKKSIDARARQTWINLGLVAYIHEPAQQRLLVPFEFREVRNAPKKVIIVGAGPAGLFAALQLIELGIKPIILERGKDVKSRRRDLAAMNKQGIVHPESNYCFGEGGAGTYSDGKLYTRSNKRGDIDRILSLFVHFGAEEKILYEAHPHIGTNKLPKIITTMREKIIDCGGEVLFESKVTDFIIAHSAIKAVVLENGSKLEADAVLLATGHSARDIFYLLQAKNILIEAKPFALGVRAEHPQQLIDRAQYKCDLRGNYLPPASYSLVQQVQNVGVFSFCMCPGGIIAPAATGQNEIVVNGWSPSKRNNPYANSGIVVQVQLQDVLKQNKQNFHSLTMLEFQQKVEQAAFYAGGGMLKAPAQRMVDFCTNKFSSTLPDCSYLPGINSTDLRNVLPSFISQTLQKAFVEFGKKMKGYYTNEAVLVATESRTSAPVRIPRDAETLQHPQIKNLYPCGEGAGYAGGIVSAAMDGERVAKKMAELFQH
ncbi:MAG TPA: FAD-dependent monooxygenase [Niabella sp.]|nr:FAD-dependent monooxygenase [Niabella sp.]HQW14403.1 FAD-dependent monooxygenase [Niabella sp.]HQX18318.1 FAD-dependent monooxygenase [Niabella sp.]HQX42632.1 FAD-dependent monooxygenase [Niabella sp.]HRB05843.1 FAD-dependent monooxygenase [Niabella sp.]